MLCHFLILVGLFNIIVINDDFSGFEHIKLSSFG